MAPQTGRGNTLRAVFTPHPTSLRPDSSGRGGRLHSFTSTADRSSCLLFTLCHYVSRRPSPSAARHMLVFILRVKMCEICVSVSVELNFLPNERSVRCFKTGITQESKHGLGAATRRRDATVWGVFPPPGRGRPVLWPIQTVRFLTIYFITVHTESGRMCVIRSVWDLTCLS